MMMRKTQIKQTALVLTFVYLFLSGFMAVGMEGHAPTHEHGSNHAAQHSSLICDWMCTASSFVHSGSPSLNQSFGPSFEKPVIDSGRFLGTPFIFSFYIRPPPVSIS
jgi:hypothetical protein